MSALLARIMLALLMLPLGTLLYVLIAAAGLSRNAGPEAWTFLAAGLVTGLFVITYWVLLWRTTVRWTSGRVGVTLGAVLGALAIGTVVSLPFGPLIDPSFAAFVAPVAALLLWLAATVVIWRETPAERLDRLSALDATAVLCPACGYDLAGIRSTTCPECGSTFRLDELVASVAERRLDVDRD